MQYFMMTLLSLQTIGSRIGSSFVVIIGMACTVASFVSILAMSVGFSETIKKSGHPDRVIILSQGSLYEMGSSINRTSFTAISDSPGIKKTHDGKPILTADALVYAPVTKKSDGWETSIVVRGVKPLAAMLRPEVKLISGRAFIPGRYEAIVGRSAHAAYEGLEVGQKISLPDADWTITGIFESDGSANESEIMTDADTLLSATHVNTYKSATVLLKDPRSFDRFKSSLTTNPRLAVDVFRETEFFQAQSKSFHRLLLLVAYVVGGAMGLGASFGALNTMYTAVRGRLVEIATLRAIGFQSAAVVFSVLFEALALCFLGAALGVLISWAAFNGHMHSLAGTVIQLSVTPEIAALGVVCASALGVLASVVPAVYAASKTISDALRAV